MSSEELSPYPTKQDRFRLRLLHNTFLRILTSSVSEAKINFLDGETLFHERVYSNKHYRISSPISDLQSLPNAHSTFVILLNASPFVRRQESEGNETRGYIVVVPPDVEQSFLISAREAEEQGERHNINFLPTNPEVIHEIMAERDIMAQPIREGVLNALLGYFVNLGRKLPVENNR